MVRVRQFVVVALLVAGAMAVVPIATQPAGAEEPSVDASITIDGPAGPVRVGDLFTVVLRPGSTGDEGPLPPTFTIQLDLPPNVELFDSRSQRASGAADCSVDGRALTCTDWTFGAWPLRFLATGTGPATFEPSITIDQPEPVPDPTPNTASVSVDVVASTKDVTVVPTYEPTGTVGVALTLSLTVLDGSGVASPPTYTVGGEVVWTIPDELQVTGARLVPAFDPDQDTRSAPTFGPGACRAIGQAVTCDGLHLRADADLVQVDVVPQVPGTWPVTATHSPGPGQADPFPDPSPNQATWEVSVVPATAGIAGTLTDPSTGAGVGGALVLAYLPGDGFFPTQPEAVATTTGTGGFAMEGLTPGDYRLLVLPSEGSPLPQQWLVGGRSRAGADVVALDPGDQAQLGAVELVEDRVITGTVTASGTPVGGVVVRAFATGVNWVPTSVTVTAPDGTFALRDLALETYELYLLPPPGSGLPTTWWNAAGTRAGATPITVSATGTIGGIDTDLAAPPG